MYRSLPILVALLLVVAGSRAALAQASKAPQAIKAHPDSRVIQGPNGERVTIVFLEPRAKGVALVKFQGVEGVWRNRVFRHQRVVFDKNRENYELLDGHDDPNYVSIVHRDAVYDVYPKGATRAPLRMVHDAGESKAVDAASIVDEYVRSRR